MKRIIGITLIAIIAVTVGWNFSQNQNKVELSELALANVEALANNEDDGVSRPCPESGGTCIVEVGSTVMIQSGHQKKK